MQDDNINLYDQYIRDELSQTDKAGFENRLTTDPGFQQGFEDFKLVVAASGEAGSANIRARMNAMHDEFFRDKVSDNGRQIGRNIAPRTWLLAASLIATAALSIWFLTMQSASPAALFAENISAYSLPAAPRGNSGKDDAWEKFAMAYENKNYNEALLALDSINGDRQAQYLVAFYKGVCKLLIPTPDAQGAIEQFGLVLQTPNNFHEQSLWYTGLANLRLGKTDEAIRIFEQLNSASKYRHAETTEILEKLK